MPVPRSEVGTELILVLAYGNLSHLEVCSLLGDDLLSTRRVAEDVLTIELKRPNDRYQELAGIHKAAAPATQLIDDPVEGTTQIHHLLENLDDGFRFSVSYYSSQAVEESEYESIVSTILSIVRDCGFRKAKLVRARRGTEVYGEEVSSRQITDIVVLKIGDQFRIGVTFYVPNTVGFRTRSNNRPVVSSQISVSSRLAKVLLNIGGLSRGKLVLDPFCGSGTILSEAVLSGINCIGVDKSPGRVENARRNLEWISEAGKDMGSYSLEVGDATRLESVLDGRGLADAVVTEPILLPKIDYAPRLEKAKKLVRNASRLYSESLYSIAPTVRSGGRVVMVAPSLRTSEGREVSVKLESLEEIGLRAFQPPGFPFEYPVTMTHESTKWIRRLVYVFEHV